MRRGLLAGLWPGWVGLVVPGLWVAYALYAQWEGRAASEPAGLVAFWPALPLYIGSCLVARWGQRDPAPRPTVLLAVGVAMAAADLAIKAWIEGHLAYHTPYPLLGSWLAIDRVHNIYGTMLAIPGAKPYVTALAALLGPVAVLGYLYYRAHEPPVVWAHVGFVGFFAGALGKAGDLLSRGLVVDYLHIPGLPIADLADVYLIWIGAGCILAATLCYPEAWPDVWRRRTRGDSTHGPS